MLARPEAAPQACPRRGRPWWDRALTVLAIAAFILLIWGFPRMFPLPS